MDMAREYGDTKMPASQSRTHRLVLHRETDGLAGRTRVRKAFAAVADCGLKDGRPEPRWMFDDALRPDADLRMNVRFLTTDVKHLRRVLEAARQEGPVVLREAILRARAYHEAKLDATLAGFEQVTVDVSMLSDEAVTVTREANDIAPAVAEYLHHQTPGTWARAKKEITELQDRVRTFLTLGKAQHESPHRLPAA